jgi:uncharacterized protein (DUF1501 family)
MDHQRRTFLSHGLAAGTLLGAGSLFTTRLALGAPSAAKPRFMFVLLRGALDGLAAVPPVGDPDYVRLRGELAIAAPGATGGGLPLNDLFALHPSLSFLSEQWSANQLSVVHAVATPYRERSHFDAQDVLETGFVRPHASRSGWLNRALSGLPAQSLRGSQTAGVALGANIPLVMRGEVEVASWSPSRMADIDSDTLQRLADLYAGDPLLSHRLADALAAEGMAANGMVANAMAPNGMAAQMDRAGRGQAAQLTETVTVAAKFLTQEQGPRVAVFETTGWDTHANEGADKGALALRLAALDAGLRALHDAMGPSWRDTVVLVATEFGRTAAVNGTRGTDHGTGAAAFLLGGAVRGGRIVGDWPGLAKSALHEGRDLAPTTDLRSVMKTVLRDHLSIGAAQIDRDIFPDSSSAKYLSGLV